MSAAHFYLWFGIAVLIACSCVIAYSVRSLRIRQNSTTNRILAMSGDIESIQKWATSYADFHQKASKLQSERVEDINKRLIDIETDNKITPPVKRDDEDPFTGSRSWSAQAAAAERGQGVI